VEKQANGKTGSVWLSRGQAAVHCSPGRTHDVLLRVPGRTALSIWKQRRQAIKLRREEGRREGLRNAGRLALLAIASSSACPEPVSLEATCAPPVHIRSKARVPGSARKPKLQMSPPCMFCFAPSRPVCPAMNPQSSLTFAVRRLARGPAVGLLIHVHLVVFSAPRHLPEINRTPTSIGTGESLRCCYPFTF